MNVAVADRWYVIIGGTSENWTSSGCDAPGVRTTLDAQRTYDNLPVTCCNYALFILQPRGDSQ